MKVFVKAAGLPVLELQVATQLMCQILCLLPTKISMIVIRSIKTQTIINAILRLQNILIPLSLYIAVRRWKLGHLVDVLGSGTFARSNRFGLDIHQTSNFQDDQQYLYERKLAIYMFVSVVEKTAKRAKPPSKVIKSDSMLGNVLANTIFDGHKYNHSILDLDSLYTSINITNFHHTMQLIKFSRVASLIRLQWLGRLHKVYILGKGSNSRIRMAAKLWSAVTAEIDCRRRSSSKSTS